MASTPVTTSSKGTRKTYSFEEREILVNLITKYLNVNEDDKNFDISLTNPKRKSIWSQLTEEYNTLVGPDNTRTSIQLRRCWENMKANKKNRDDKRVQDKSMNENMQGAPLPTMMMGLPPNVVFQPKESEPFTFEGLISPSTSAQTIKTEDALNETEEEGLAKKQQVNDDVSASVDELPTESDDPPAKKVKGNKVLTLKKQTKEHKIPKFSKVQKAGELLDFAISEAQLKLDTAALLKEEAKLKLEEAEYKKEEAKMRMICASYKLQKLREENEFLEDEEIK